MSGTRAAPHVPVMLAEALAHLAPAAGDVVVDGTFGAGGYSRAILAAADCRVIAFDRDPSAVTAGAALVAGSGGRLMLVGAAFGDLEQKVRGLLAAEEPEAVVLPLVDAVVLDIGVSSMQLDQPERGFSFMADGPLDMRMGEDGPPVGELLAMAGEEMIADVIFHLGEERQARRIARAIVRARDAAPLTTTRQLATIVERAIGRHKGDDRHPATRTFQALRIWANDELGELARGLAGAERILEPGGRLVVVSFQSLEDRVVKRFLARRARPAAAASRHAPPTATASERAPSFRIVNQRPLEPSASEVAANPRARSAKLRAAVRTGAEAWPPETMGALGIPQFDGRPGRRQ